ncbi:MAG: PadR family transcriptional regulator [Promethearchaeota archaeon]
MEKKIIPRRALDLIILSIIDQNQDGLTGYALVNKFKEYFPLSNISPGTLYPKLRKLSEAGEISENNKVYTVTEKGKKRLMTSGPEIIQNSIEFLPRLFKTLIKPLPFFKQLDFPDFWYISDYRFLDDIISSDEFCCTTNVSQSVKNLERLKERLEKEKINLTNRYKEKMEYIDKKIKLIDEKAKKCEEEKKTWTKIKIEED